MELTKNKKVSLKKAILKTIQSFRISIPIIIGVLLLVNLINIYAKDYYLSLFTGNLMLDSFIGALAGSISLGIPLTSYVIGGELLKEGISLIAITAFILSWTTVGIAMLPLEIKFMGKRFALIRNTVNFIFAIIISILVILTLSIL
ncbi:MAG: hypothetical protein KAS02_02995 [Candidatus Pacebacteria bacterium]|nr:hypothetical protein [Candidatus Paceibacterota bacterium]